jgi:hypothetical protein
MDAPRTPIEQFRRIEEQLSKDGAQVAHVEALAPRPRLGGYDTDAEVGSTEWADALAKQMMLELIGAGTLDSAIGVVAARLRLIFAQGEAKGIKDAGEVIRGRIDA